MDDIIAHLHQSIADEVLSKAEKKTLKEMVAEKSLSTDQLNFLRSQIYELANTKVTDANYRFILEWVKSANSALLFTPVSNDKSDAYFSPGETCRDTIISQINRAIKQLKICVFTISDDRITESILSAHRRKIDIKIITDNDKSMDIGSDIEHLAKTGISVKMDTTSDHMHHKFMVADGKTLLTGSYNWTSSAARYNHENIVLTNEIGLVKSFLHEFESLWPRMEEVR